MVWRARGRTLEFLFLLAGMGLVASVLRAPSGTSGATDRDPLVATGRFETAAATGAAPASVPPADSAEIDADTSSLGDTCVLCAPPPGIPIRVLTAQDALGIGHAYAESTVVRLARIDSLLSAGDFGLPSNSDARRKAHLMARLLTPNAYSYMIRFATSRDTIYEANEGTLQPAFETFSDPGVYPIARLQRARMGLGRMCARYDLSRKMETSTMLGGERLRVRIDDADVEGRRQRMLIMDLPTGLFSVVQVLIAAEITSDVEYQRCPGPPAPYELYLMEHLRGIWVHKWGMHRPQAFMFWVTPRDPRRTTLPEVPLIGVRIYVPHMRLSLPWILPSLRVENLREIDLPQPILELSYLRQHLYPSWLRPAKMRGFADWHGAGPLPPTLRQRFPNL